MPGGRLGGPDRKTPPGPGSHPGKSFSDRPGASRGSEIATEEGEVGKKLQGPSGFENGFPVLSKESTHMPRQQRPRFTSLTSDTHSTRPSVQILVACGADHWSSRLVEGLAAVGLRARSVADVHAGLCAPLPSLLVLDDQLPGAPPLELLRELRQRWPQLASLVMAHTPSFEVARDAFSLGSRDVLPAPFECDDVIEAIEAAVDGLEPAGEDDFHFRGSATEEGLHSALRHWLAHLCMLDVSVATRARAVSATAEVLHNVVRHAYPDHAGEFRLSANNQGSVWNVTVRDEGCGWPVGSSPTGGGLDRARALVEGLQARSLPGLGTTVDLEFIHQPVSFECADPLDLSESDYLEPSVSRSLIAAARSGQPLPPHTLPPALAVCLGRLLADDSTASGGQRALAG